MFEVELLLLERSREGEAVLIRQTMEDAEQL